MLRSCIRFLERVDAKLQAARTPATGQMRPVGIDEINGNTLDFVSPCFVLSTGRCGTLWLTELLRPSRQALVNHSEYPELIRHSRLAYEQYEQTPRVFCEIIRATRDELIIEAYKREQVYVETNNRITFFAHAIKQVYPKARFIHLVRHPGDFVRSGWNRKWYDGHPHDVGRIVKLGPSDAWQAMSDIEKIAWLWNETNRYVEDFLSGLPQDSYVQVKAEDMFSDPCISTTLCEFIALSDIAPKSIARMLRQRVNEQRHWAIGPYEAWPDASKQQVRGQATLASGYGYSL